MRLPDLQTFRRQLARRVESRSLAVATLAFLLVVTGLQWWQLESSTQRVREETLAQAKLRATEVTGSAAELVEMLLLQVDVASRDLVRAYASANGTSFDNQVQQVAQRMPANSLLQAAVIDADGYLAYSNLGVKERTFLGDREHFKVHLEGDTEGFFISKPVLGRVSKQWSIQFSRPIRKQGRLVGVLVMSISPAFLQESMARLALQPDSALAVLRASGEILARNRDLEAALGKGADPQAPFLAPGAGPSGHYTAYSTIDGVERIYQWQRLSAYPVHVVLGLGTDSTLRPLEQLIREARFRALVSTALLWGGVMAVALLLRRMGLQRQERQALEFAAMNDSLTGLHSRHALHRHLAQSINDAAGRGGALGVLFVDLDGFKPINDRHGHGVGDEVLKAIAGRICSHARRNDFPARLGGDEFVVVIAPLAHPAILENLHVRIEQALQAPVVVGDLHLEVQASFGLAYYPEDGTTADALLDAADRRMYVHKRTVREPLPLAGTLEIT